METVSLVVQEKHPNIGREMVDSGRERKGARSALRESFCSGESECGCLGEGLAGARGKKGKKTFFRAPLRRLGPAFRLIPAGGKKALVVERGERP